MVPISSLWLPIALSAVFVFVASSIIHMMLGYHKTDFRRVPDEDAAQSALRGLNIPPGDYMLPYAATSAEMKDAAYTDRLNKGPVVIMTVAPPGPFAMGSLLGQWFGFSVLVSVFAAYVATRTLDPGASYLGVFRITATVAFVGYSLAQFHDSIWYRRSWSVTMKNALDGLVYGLVTGGTFGWLWP
jgi:hypothetical protein